MLKTQVPNELFIRFFRPSIRVLLNWDRFSAESWPVYVSVITSLVGSNQFYAPWYLSQSGEEASYLESNARPVRISQTRNVFNRLSGERRANIQSFAQQFRGIDTYVQMVVPVYAVACDTLLVLDGNHRLAALALYDLAFRMMLFTVDGPVESDVLPDLIHWQHA